MKFLFMMVILASSFSFAGTMEYSYTCTTGEGKVVHLEYRYDNGYKMTALTLNGSNASNLVKSGSFGFSRDTGVELVLSGFPAATYETKIIFGRNDFQIGLMGSFTKKSYPVTCIYTDLSKKAADAPLKF